MKSLLRFFSFMCLAFLLTGRISAQTVKDPSRSDPTYDQKKREAIRSNLTGNAPASAPTLRQAAASAAQILAEGDNCFIPIDESYTAVPRNDDGSYGPISLPFEYDLYGTTYNQAWINTNGNLTFTGDLPVYNASGFPFNIPMVAPFWADIDTRPSGSGAIYFKVSPNSLIVTWDNVGYYSGKTDKRNTFQVIITNGLDPAIGVGNNTAFYYQDMQWTTGDASDGVNGFGGVPATAGVNKGNTDNFIQIGRFGLNSSVYDGPGGSTDGINYLDNQCFNFVVGDAVNLPPSVSGIPVGNTVTLNVGEVITLSPQFIGPEVGQLITTQVNTRGLCNVDQTVTNGEVSRVNMQITGAACNVGTNVITLTAADNGTPAQTTVVNLTVIVNKMDQTIRFDPIPDKMLQDSPFSMTATTSSGLPVSYSVVSGPATISGNVITLTGTGEVIVRASQLGDDIYNAASPIDRSFNVTSTELESQTIVFADIADMTFGQGPVTLVATASSGLPVSFEVVSGPATVSGNILTINGAGDITVRAMQAGNSTYSAATPVSQTFSVQKATQSITFMNIPDKALGDAPFMLSATSSSGLPVSFRVVSGPATISGNMLTMTGTGMVVVRASQPGNDNYDPASPVERSFNVISGPVATGGILWEYLLNAPSSANLPSDGGLVQPFIPTGSRVLTSFATPRNFGQQYFSRARGYVVAPVSGNYVFMVAGDDRAELWLSTDEMPNNKRMIASVYRNTSQFQYNKYASQTLAPIYLEAGQRYYIEALHREYRGVDHLSVGWMMPDGTMEQVISGQYLRPYEPDGLVWEYLMNPPAWADVPSEGGMIPEFEPTGTRMLNSFATPRNFGQQYFSRARGYVVAPVSGNYVFMVAGDDHAELWLSTDEMPANKSIIAHLYSHTSQFQYDRYASQTSAPVYLEAGQRYYIEALHREYRGVDHLSVGWMMPDGTMEQVISGQYLRPYKAEMEILAGLVSESGLVAKSAKVENRAEASEDPLQTYPNPFYRDLTVAFTLEQAEDQVVVEVFSLHGKKLNTLHNGKAEAGVTYSYTFNGDRHATGVYLCRMTYQGKAVVKRIVLAK